MLIIANMTLTLSAIFTILHCHILVFQMIIFILSKLLLISIIFVDLYNLKGAGIAQSVQRLPTG